MGRLLLVCLALAAASLLLPSSPTYDPWAWIIWGREITEGALDTREGPSWKPLPILFTTPFALLGDAVAPEAWLVVARTGGLVAIALTYRLGARLAGPVAGVVAAGGLVLADEFVRNFARGNSEGILVALCLLAVERHLDGRRGQAFALGAAAGLLRPEVWPLLGLYGLWLARAAPRRWLLVLAATFAGFALAWFLPEYLGSGDPLRASNRALQPNADAATFAAVPALEVLRRSAGILPPPVPAGALVALVLAWRARPRDRAVLGLGAAAAALMVVVAVMTQIGYAGNLRYVALPAALVCVLAGAGYFRLVACVPPRRRRLAVTALAVASAPLVVLWAGVVATDLRALRDEADFHADLGRAIAAAGGPERLRDCGGRIATSPFQVQTAAWILEVHGGDVLLEPAPTGVVLRPRFERSPDVPAGYEVLARTGRWLVAARCSA